MSTKRSVGRCNTRLVAGRVPQLATTVNEWGQTVKSHQARAAFAGGMAAASALALGGVVMPSADAGTPSGGNGRLAFVSHNQIFTIDPSGSDRVQITTFAGSDGKNYLPEWSPSGKRIAYVHETLDGLRDIWIMRWNGTHPHQMTDLGRVSRPNWSPDGTMISFAGRNISTMDQNVLMTQRVVKPVGTPRIMLGYFTGSWCADEDPQDAHPLAVTGNPAWNLPGGRIALTPNNECSNGQDAVWYVDVATGETREGITSDPANTHMLGRMEYGPDNRVYMGVQAFPGTVDAENRVICTCVGFSDVGQLGDTWPAPSPNGNRIAVTNPGGKLPGGTPAVMVSDLDGSNRHFVAWGYQPSWQPVP